MRGTHTSQPRCGWSRALMWRQRTVAIASVLLLLAGLAVTPAAAVAAPPMAGPKEVVQPAHHREDDQPRRSCESLAQLHLPNTVTISAVTNASGSFQPPFGPPLTGLPAFCRVTLTVTAHINIEAWLPLTSWNERFQAVGGGGFAGVISYGALANALRGGYASASTDTGHNAFTQPGGSFALNPDGTLNFQVIEDFAFRSEHQMTLKAKEVLHRFYGRPAEFSYWNGCSTGGRQGLMEAQRFPDDYDGILAGAPAINWSKFIPAEFWPQLVMLQAHDFVAQCKFAAANAAAVSVCDGLDGVVDGIIDDPRACHFDPATLVGTATPCGTITAADADIIRQIWQGPREANGEFLWFGLEPGASFGGLANTRGDGSDGIPFPIATDWIRFFLLQNPGWDWHTATFSQFVDLFQQSVAQYSPVIATDDPNLQEFKEHRAKLIIWHGWSDQLIFPRGTVQYYERVQHAMGTERTMQFARLFMAPGVGHCGGGAGPAPADPFGALVNWVENHQAPDQLLATKTDAGGNVVLSRPLCPFPEHARYTGRGSTNDAANFDCR